MVLYVVRCTSVQEERARRKDKLKVYLFLVNKTEDAIGIYSSPLVSKKNIGSNVHEY